MNRTHGPHPLVPRLIGIVILCCTVQVQPVWAQENHKDIPLRSTCMDAECHSQYREATYGHSPVLLNKCDACHKTIENRHKFLPIESTPGLCTFCHKIKLKNFVHKPVREGKCLECHNPHGSEFPFIMKSDPSKQLCKTCHQETDTFLQKSFLHAPVAQGACILCHRGHSSWNEHLLINEGNDLCLFCHEKEFGPLLKMRHIHKPAAESCLKCHDPHSSNNPMMIPKAEPQFCYDCHEDIEQLIRSSSNVHEAAIIGKSCSNCHSPHASSLPRLLEKPMLDVCLSCHNKEIETYDGTVLDNIALLLEENPVKHGPIKQNNCIACHNPHASNIFRRLVSYFPKDFYAPFNLGEYNLCFQCHSKDTFLEERTTALTNFRNGDLNLHYLHVHKQEKGRTCRACHEIHASSQQAHIRATVPYGNWEFPVVFKANENGGTCEAGCHAEKSYSRKYQKIEPLPATTTAPP